MTHQRLTCPPDLFHKCRVVTHSSGDVEVVSDGSIRTLPPYIEAYDFHTTSGVPVHFYIARAPRQKIIKFGASGYKSDFLRNPAEIEQQTKNGITNAWFGIPNSVRKSDFMDFILEAAKEVLINPRHVEIRKLCESSDPKIFEGHSTGMQLFFRLALESHVEKLNETFSGVSAISTYITPPGLEKTWSASNATFNSYAWLHADKIPSETFWGATFLGNSEIQDAVAPEVAQYRIPTYGQIQELRRGGGVVHRALLDSDSPIHDLSMPFFVAAGSEDKFASPTIQAMIAQNFKGAFYYAQGMGHSPLCNNPEGFNLEQKAVLAMVKGHKAFDAFAKANNLHNYDVDRSNIGLMPLIQSGASELLSSGISRLNPYKPSESANTPL